MKELEPAFGARLLVALLALAISACGKSSGGSLDAGAGRADGKGPAPDVRRIVDGGFDYAQSAFGIFSAYTCPPMSQFSGDCQAYFKWTDTQMAALGAHWTRFALIAPWTFIEPTLGGGYDWSAPGSPGGSPDQVLGAVYDGANQIEAVFNIQSLSFDGAPPTRSPLTNPDEYKAFVQALAGRYPKVRFFQLANELQDWFGRGLSVAQYATAAQLTLSALRAANPNAQLVLVAQPDAGDVLSPQLNDLIGACHSSGVDFGAVDIHWYMPAASPWRSGAFPQARSYLNSLGLNHVEIRSMENGMFVGAVTIPGASTQAYSEHDQASILVKRFVWGRANGLAKIMWIGPKDWYNFGGDPKSAFNCMGLIDDGMSHCGAPFDPSRANRPRMSYWSYQKLAAKTDNMFATPVGTVAGAHDGKAAFAYQYTRKSDGKALYVLWREGSSGNLTLNVVEPSYTATDLVPDVLGNFQTSTLAARAGQVAVSLGDDPVLLEP